MTSFPLPAELWLAPFPKLLNALRAVAALDENSACSALSNDAALPSPTTKPEKPLEARILEYQAQ